MEKSKSQRAREFMEQNPEAKPEQIAAAVEGMPLGYARTWLSDWRRKQNPPKPRTKKKRKVMAKFKEVAADEIVRLHEIIERQANRIAELQVQVDNLHHQATGYESVISYLEHKMGGR
jgi:hypothetical protein